MKSRSFHMKVLGPIWLWVLWLLLVAGCATNSLRVESVPEGAEVFLVKDLKTKRLLGKTPLTLDERIQPEVFGQSSQIEITLPEHLSESLLVPRSLSPSSMRLAVTLKQVELPEACTRQTAAAAALARGVAEAQSLIVRRNYAQAESILRTLSDTFPQVPAIYDLLGNLFYLQKDVKKALAFYRRSNDLEPNNPQTLRMIDKLSAIRGETGSGTRSLTSPQGGG